MSAGRHFRRLAENRVFGIVSPWMKHLGSPSIHVLFKLFYLCPVLLSLFTDRHCNVTNAAWQRYMAYRESNANCVTFGCHFVHPFAVISHTDKPDESRSYPTQFQWCSARSQPSRLTLSGVCSVALRTLYTIQNDKMKQCRKIKLLTNHIYTEPGHIQRCQCIAVRCVPVTEYDTIWWFPAYSVSTSEETTDDHGNLGWRDVGSWQFWMAGCGGPVKKTNWYVLQNGLATRHKTWESHISTAKASFWMILASFENRGKNKLFFSEHFYTL